MWPRSCFALVLIFVAPISQLYIGNLAASVEQRDLEDVFGKFGRVSDVWVARKPPG